MRSIVAALVVAAALLPSFGTRAQSTWDNAIKTAEHVAPLKDGVFGDAINHATGALSFEATDLAIPGNSALPVAVGRSYVAELGRMKAAAPDPAKPQYGHVQVPRKYLFGDWDLALPHIGGTFAGGAGWQHDSTTPFDRCSVLGQKRADGSPTTGQPKSSSTMVDAPFWGGHRLHANGRSEPLLLAKVASTPRPTTGGPYHWVTKDNWWVSCVPAANTTGEGFLAIDPQGTKYWLTWLSVRNVGEVHETVEVGDAKFRNYYLYLDEWMFLATKIQDRFGNTVEIQYSSDAFARPLKIVSNDLPTPRQITFAYNAQGLIASVSDGVRTVSYGYATDAQGYPTLTSVTLPDASKWRYDFRLLSRTGAVSGYDPDHPCARPAHLRPPLSSYDCVGWPAETASVAASVTHPSGARGDYVLQTRYQATGAGGYTWRYPLAVTERTTSGPGLAPMQWTYTFGPSVAEVQAQCRAGACPTRGWTDEVEPGHRITRRVFGLQSNVDRGLMVQKLDGGFAGEAPAWKRDTRFAYRVGAAVGVLPGEGQSTAPLFTNMRQFPVAEQVVLQDGDAYTTQVETWDAFDRPLIVQRTGSETRRERTDYADNTALWVVGQVARSVYLGPNGNIAESETQYESATALPSKTFAFGKLQKAFTYDARGNIASVSDGRDAPAFDTTVWYGEWKRGLPGRIAFPDGTTRSAEIDARGRVASVTDENGYVTCHAHDAMGRLARIEHPADAQPLGRETCGTDRWNPVVRSFAPSAQAAFGLAAGHWVETTSVGNARTETHFDALWRPVVTERYDAADKAATLSQVVQRHDVDGQVVYASYPTTGIASYTATAPGTRTTYDAIGRATRVEQDAESPWGVLASTTDYLSGFRARTTNPMGQSTTTTFKAYDQPRPDWPTRIERPGGAITDIARDAFGKPTSMRRHDAAGTLEATRTYGYTQAQELCRVNDPESGSTYMGYDAAGNVKWSAIGYAPGTTCVAENAVASRRSDRTYDQRNRLVDLRFGDRTGEQAWTYTPDGRVATVTTWNGANRTAPYVNKYRYNKRGLPDNETGQDGDDATYWYRRGIGYGYDRNGALAHHVQPDGAVVDYAPNALGQATRAGAFATDATYHPNGALRQFTYGNGVVHAMGQNLRQLPERSRDAFGDVAFLDDHYDYDGNGNVLSISDGTAGQRGNRDMAYDALDRLVATTSPWFGGTIGYAYDVLDNLVSVTRPAGPSLRYCYNAKGQLAFLRNGANTACTSGEAAAALTWDLQGNLSQKNDQRFTFTQDNRLRNVLGKEYYRYDGHGRRTLGYLPSLGNLFYLYGHDGVLRHTQDDRRGKQSHPVYLAGSLVATREVAGDTTTVQYHHTDALGSPAVTTDASRNVIERSEREPFGQLRNRPTHDGPGFTGHAEDAQTGLTYMQQRYYDPAVGAFLSVDPVTAHGSGDTRFFNRYAYAFDNPYKFTDPDGRFPFLVPIVFGIGAYLTSNYANAPAVGEQTMSMSKVDQVAAALPPARPAGLIKVAIEESRGPRKPTSAQREDALQRSKGEDGKERCAYCNVPLDRKSGNTNSAEIDHKTAFSKGGKTEEANLDAACRTCNRSKGAKELNTEWVPPKERE